MCRHLSRLPIWLLYTGWMLPEPQLICCSMNHCCSESGCVLPTSTCPIHVHNVQMVGERSSHQFAHIKGNLINTSTQSTYTSYRIPYSRECGRIIAYDFGTPNRFRGYTFYKISKQSTMGPRTVLAPVPACCEFINPPWFCKQLNQTTIYRGRKSMHT